MLHPPSRVGKLFFIGPHGSNFPQASTTTNFGASVTRPAFRIVKVFTKRRRFYQNGE